jgi:hypothetical protein
VPHRQRLLGVREAKCWQSHRWPRFVTAGLHRNLSLLAVDFVVHALCRMMV